MWIIDKIDNVIDVHDEATITHLEALLLRCLLRHYFFDKNFRDKFPLSEKTKAVVELLRWDILIHQSADIEKRREYINVLFTLIKEVS